ncbi:hypothetical protein N9937_01605 [bacterium]|nr:hypothetical protein [bacterium]
MIATLQYDRSKAKEEKDFQAALNAAEVVDQAEKYEALKRDVDSYDSWLKKRNSDPNMTKDQRSLMKEVMQRFKDVG